MKGDGSDLAMRLMLERSGEVDCYDREVDCYDREVDCYDREVDCYDREDAG